MDSSTTPVLIVTPDPTERGRCSAWLRQAGLEVVEACDAGEALRHHERRTIPLTVSEARLPELGGIELLHRIQRLNADAEVALLADSRPCADAVAAIKAGAFDVLDKPVDRRRLVHIAKAAAEQRAVAEDLASRADRLFREYSLDGIVARSDSMLRVLELAVRVAPLNCTLLVSGPTGAGKEVLARAIHANSPRAAKPFVSVNCAAIPASLLESELFGYVRGAFTGADHNKTGLLESARGGTLLLDEVAEMEPAVQAKLLHFLQHRTFCPVGSVQAKQADVRIVSATNAPLQERVREGTLREDLYYRLCVFPLYVAPLQERPEDIAPLAQHFLRRLDGRLGKRVPDLSAEACRHLASRVWHGNVRELENAVERAAIVSRGDLLTSADFRVFEASRPDDEGPPSQTTPRLPDEGVDLEALVCSLTAQALERASYRVAEAARLLHISRATLRYRMKKYGLGRGSN